MGSNFLWLVLITLVWLGGWSNRCHGCLKQEKLALLHLKPLFDDPYFGWESWKGHDDSSDCCQWSQVECNTTTGRVIELYLSSVFHHVLYLNSSLFLPFEELKILDLSSNGIAGFFEDKGFQGQLRNLELLDLRSNELDESILWSLGRFPSIKCLFLGLNAFSGKGIYENISRLTSLETLDLSSNTLNCSILSYLGGLPSLKTLILDDSIFKGRIHLEDQLNLKNLESLSIFRTSIHKSFLQSIGSMTSLQVLSLRGCKFRGALPAKGLCELTLLKKLDMRNNKFSGNLPWCFSNLTSLERLDLSFNQFSGNIALSPFQNLTSMEFFGWIGLCKLTHLKQLVISNNNFNGNFPWCFSNLTSLERLDLSYNQFSGSITLSQFQSLTSLQYLDLSDNQLQIPSSLRPFLNLSKLKSISADHNQVYDDGELYSSVPKFQLNTIHLACYGNGGALPKFLYHQHDLQKVDLSNINLSGDFPNWLLENNTELQTLNLRNNTLSGPLQMPFQSHKNLSWLDVSDNFLHGYIEYDQEIGAYLPALAYLNISSNSFIGGIPSSFGDMEWLQFLDASNNNLSGEIPEYFAMGCYSLKYLRLSNNHLEGQVLPPKANWVSLGALWLDGNHFSGKIPKSLSKFNSSLWMLDVSNNYLSGTIPRWLGNMTTLGTMHLENNNFEGPIPIELCQLSSLHLSGNNISGNLLSCSFPSMEEIYLSRNRLEGPLDAICNNSLYLLALDLSDNYFTGKIPDCIDKLSDLSFLLLKKNKLEGEIPTQLCKLNRLCMIDLSHNNLSGRIPTCLNITSFKETNFPVFYPGPIGFMTKSLFYFYEGTVLYYMSGIDLSSNKLTGEIPHEIGNLSKIRDLNISHNSLTGSIPPTLSNLGLIESLDLSHNNLSGEIPPQLVDIFSLEYFSVAYNNLSGKTPARIQQFATFEKSSYEGNPLLCGEPLPNSCLVAPAPEPMSKTPNGPTDGDFFDMEVFYVSFIVSYIVVLLSIAVILYINPYWRRTWFYSIEMGYTSCYYFVVDHLP